MVKTPQKHFSKLQPKPNQTPTSKSATESVFEKRPLEQPKLHPPTQASTPTSTAKSPAQTIVSRPAAKGTKKLITCYYETKEKRNLEEMPGQPKK